LAKYITDESCECGGSVSKVERSDELVRNPLFGFESSFPRIKTFHAQMVIARG